MLFSGKDSDQFNALNQALELAAKRHAGKHVEGDELRDAVYKFIEETPRTSMVVELVQCLHSHGHKITRDDRLR